MRIFDFSLQVGTDPFSPSVAGEDALISYLDSANAGGVVSSLAGVFYDPDEANAETLRIAQADRRLIAGFAIDPRRPDAAYADLTRAAKGFGAVVLYPSFQAGIPQSWPLSHPAVPAILSNASDAGLPVILHVARGGDVGTLAKLALEVEVPVVALGLSYAASGEIVAGAAAVPNLLFGISYFAGLGDIEMLASKLGAQSGCVWGQGFFGGYLFCHFVLFLTIVLRITRSLRMHAVRITL